MGSAPLNRHRIPIGNIFFISRQTYCTLTPWSLEFQKQPVNSGRDHGACHPSTAVGCDHHGIRCLQKSRTTALGPKRRLPEGQGRGQILHS